MEELNGRREGSQGKGEFEQIEQPQIDDSGSLLHSQFVLFLVLQTLPLSCQTAAFIRHFAHVFPKCFVAFLAKKFAEMMLMNRKRVNICTSCRKMMSSIQRSLIYSNHRQKILIALIGKCLTAYLASAISDVLGHLAFREIITFLSLRESTRPRRHRNTAKYSRIDERLGIITGLQHKGIFE